MANFFFVSSCLRVFVARYAADYPDAAQSMRSKLPARWRPGLDARSRFELTFSGHAGNRLRACSRGRIRAGARSRVWRDERHASFTDAHLFNASERDDN